METLALALPGLDVPAPAPEPEAAPALYVVVYGTPAVAGSKKRVPVGNGNFRVIDDSKKSGPWKTLVAQHAGEAMAGRPLLRGALRVSFAFLLRRPQGHYGRRGLRASAPAYPAKRPDLLKRARAVEDALTGVVYADDSQIVTELLTKRYAESEGVEILVVEMNRRTA